MRSLLEVKTPQRSIARSYILTTPESSNIGVLEVRTEELLKVFLSQPALEEYGENGEYSLKPHFLTPSFMLLGME